MSDATQVLIVGRRTCRCAAALTLRPRRHAVTWQTSTRFPRDKVCGEPSSPDALAALTGWT